VGIDRELRAIGHSGRLTRIRHTFSGADGSSRIRAIGQAAGIRGRFPTNLVSENVTGN
jgi:hypothetical protein